MDNGFSLKVICLWILLIIICSHYTPRCFGCLEEERIGLLQLKASINNGSFYDSLVTWVDEKESDCCGWERVECDNTTGRVIRLSLNDTYIVNDAPSAILFLPFRHLRHLDLSVNMINSWRNGEDLRRLRNLKALNLGSNYFNNTILPKLGLLTSLTTLNLSMNYLTGSLSDFSTVFANLSNLEVLDLSLNSLSGYLSINDSPNVSKLQILDLSYNNISGTIPQAILSSSSLKALYLKVNDLKGSLSGICNLKNLQELDLSKNKLQGALPVCLNNLTSLKLLDVSENHLNGSLEPSLISNLEELQYFSVSRNRFEINLFFPSLANLDSQFRFLGLSDCNLNASTTTLFKILRNQDNLVGIDLSHNNLHGKFSNWLVENNPRLQVLILRNNSLRGHFRFPAFPPFSLKWIDISNNRIQGRLQTNIGEVLPELTYLNVSDNSFRGRIPTSVGNMKHMVTLDLSNNELNGQISPSLFNLSRLVVLRFRNNQFTGSFPKNSDQSIYLHTLDVSHNLLSGRIPTWIGKEIATLVMRDNLLEGSIPQQLCNSTVLQFLDLSQNQLSGPMPSCLMDIPSLSYLHLQHNELSGLIPETIILGGSRLLTLDLRHNSFSSQIPSWFGLLSNLRVLLLKGNRFKGLVPHKLCHLNKIGLLDLSHNNLSGSIPTCFSNISFGKIEIEEQVAYDQPFGTGYSLDDEYRFKNLFTENFVKYFLEFPGNVMLVNEEVEFMTKSRSNSYKGDIINSMSGMDLSCNRLKGNIPLEIGTLSEIRALNLSHNRFTGHIPKNLSNLKQVESIDLSYNKLSGEIPSELTGIYTLAVFRVAYNNLSGRIPEMKAQFSTFSETSYEGNPFLCGPPLQEKCDRVKTDQVTITDRIRGSDDKFGLDLTSLLASFAATYATFLLGFTVVLYINPDWRQRWFAFVDACMSFIFPFCEEAIYRTSNP